LEEDLGLSEGIPFSFAFASSSFSASSVLPFGSSVRRASRCRCSSMTLAISSLLGPAGVSGCGIKVALAIIPSLMSDLARSTDSLEESLQSSINTGQSVLSISQSEPSHKQDTSTGDSRIVQMLRTDVDPRDRIYGRQDRRRGCPTDVALFRCGRFSLVIEIC
jgi:hypothetical protein